jgi:hypothetical protein
VTIRARFSGPVTLRVLRRTSKRGTTPIAFGKRGVATYRNAGTRGVYVYVEVRPAGARAADYTVRLTAARR